MALNVRTGQLFGTSGVANNWLVYSPFENKYGYKFRKGKMYRILVREKTLKKMISIMYDVMEIVIDESGNFISADIVG